MDTQSPIPPKPSPNAALLSHGLDSMQGEQEPLEALFRDEQERRQELSTMLDEKLKNLVVDMKVCGQQLTSLARSVDELSAAERVIAELSDRCKELSEGFHEREVLLPVFNCLIGISDRCRQQIDRLYSLVSKYTDGGNSSAAKAVTYLLEARKADLIELDCLLANFGVETFESHQETFDPSVQKCVTRTETKDTQLHNRLAARLLPGYRRADRIIRQEYVNVYVPSRTQAGNVQGGET